MGLELGRPVNLASVPEGSERRSVPIPEGLEGERIDAALARLFGLSRTRAAYLIGEGAVLIDGQPPLKSERVTAGSVVDLDLPTLRVDQEERLVPDQMAELPVHFNDEDIVVVDKPVGVAAHPSPGWVGPTVTGSLSAAGYRLSTSGPAERQGVVHRLDVGTSGLMVVAKSEAAYSSLKRDFKARNVDKVYHAVVQGHPDPSRGTIDAPIGRHPKDDWRWAVTASGKESVTHYETLEAFPAASLLRVDLETGRTHQIRVHMSAIRHPCVGDLTYGADPTLSERLHLTRQWLHARELSFGHPTSGERVSFVSQYPSDLQRALDQLREE
jgi:23S rRNA pseudouridine1911/1915/1917 synthase